MKAEVYENPVTGERAVIRAKAHVETRNRLIADLYIRPGGAVVGEHFHPNLEERFVVVRGRVGFSVNGKTSEATPGQSVVVPAGTPHDWWNAGSEEALVRVEISPGARFQAMVMNLFGLAQDGKTDRKGMPHLLQLAMIAREFSDVVCFTNPPMPAQKALFGFLAFVGRLCGYRGSYDHYVNRPPSSRVELENYDAALTTPDLGIRGRP